jgi:hypothetical protein
MLRGWRFSLTVVAAVLSLLCQPHLTGSAEPTDVRSHVVLAAERFVDNGDGTVTDARRKLMWQQGDNGTEVTFGEAREYCRSLRLGGHSDWRLPDPSEAETAVAFALMMPRHARDVYANFDLYWSSDPTILLPFNYRPAQGRQILRTYPAEGNRAFVRAVRSITGAGLPHRYAETEQ